jgi:hypothetical protein
VACSEEESSLSESVGTGARSVNNVDGKQDFPEDRQLWRKKMATKKPAKKAAKKTTAKKKTTKKASKKK